MRLTSHARFGRGSTEKDPNTGTSPAAYLTLNTHLTAGMKAYIAAHDWLTVYQLLAYAPQLNPVEGIWSLIRWNLANTAFTDPKHLIEAVRRELRAIQYRSWLVDGVLAGTGLTLTTSPISKRRRTGMARWTEASSQQS